METTTEEEAEEAITTGVARPRRPSDGGDQLPPGPILDRLRGGVVFRSFFFFAPPPPPLDGGNGTRSFFTCGEDGPLGFYGIGCVEVPAISWAKTVNSLVYGIVVNKGSEPEPVKTSIRPYLRFQKNLTQNRSS